MKNKYLKTLFPLSRLTFGLFILLFSLQSSNVYSNENIVYPDFVTPDKLQKIQPFLGALEKGTLFSQDDCPIFDAENMSDDERFEYCMNLYYFITNNFHDHFVKYVDGQQERTICEDVDPSFVIQTLALVRWLYRNKGNYEKCTPTLGDEYQKLHLRNTYAATAIYVRKLIEAGKASELPYQELLDDLIVHKNIENLFYPRINQEIFEY